MKRNPYLAQADKSSSRYISQKRAHHQRKPTFDFVLPVAQPQKPPAFRLSHLLNESKIFRQTSPFNRRPTTSKATQNNQKRIEGTMSKNSRKANPENDAAENGKVNRSLDQKVGTASSPNSRYKSPLTDRDRREQKYDLMVTSIKERTRIYQGVSLKENEKRFSPVRRQASPRFQRFVAKTPRGYYNTRHSRNLQNPPEMDVASRIHYPRKTPIKSHIEQQDGNNFQYVLRYSYRTKKGFTPTNPSKPNQDSFIICPNIQSKTWQHYFGVNDGHGVFGHFVSAGIKSYLSSLFPSMTLQPTSIKQSLKKAYKKVFSQLYESTIDMTFSGSTMVGCFLQKDKLYCCNVGDSRAIMGSRDQTGNWRATALSRDHKPTIPEQLERIMKAGGRVEAYKDADGNDIGPLRIWVKEQQVPGLAMTRSFGDLVAASVGVSCEPEITEFTLNTKDQIIVIASDGVWQFLENEYVIMKLGYFYQNGKLDQACDWLLQASHSAWSQQCSVIDDITLIILFLSYD